MFKRTLAIIALSVALFFAAWYYGRQPEPVALTPSLTGETEYCTTCHGDLPEISPSHPVDAFGCVICHGGEALALEADLAHSTMRGGANPSDLSVVEESCGGGECHSGSLDQHRDHIQRVETSIQATYAGAIASLRYTFGEQPDLSALMGVYAIEDNAVISSSGLSSLAAFDPAPDAHPALLEFANNCLTCHISAEPLPGDEYARFTGCAACHSPVSNSEGQTHTLTTAIPYTQCNTCHNRGNYNLLDMDFHPREDQYTGRLHEYYQPIAQFTRCEYTLDCIDCHTRSEAMGDGDLHNNQAEVQYIQCKTCHGTVDERPKTYTITDPNDLSLRMALLNPVLDLGVGDTIIITEKDEPLWNARLLSDGTYEMYGKATGEHFIFRAVIDTNCEQNAAEQESHYCHECHAVER